MKTPSPRRPNSLPLMLQRSIFLRVEATSPVAAVLPPTPAARSCHPPLAGKTDLGRDLWHRENLLLRRDSEPIHRPELRACERGRDTARALEHDRSPGAGER